MTSLTSASVHRLVAGNWLDRALAFAAPGLALRRIRERRALELLSNYEGARGGRRTEGWITAGTDPNATIGPDLRLLRERSHDLIRNNPHARSAKVKICSHAVGTGLIPQADTGDDGLNKRIDAAFERFCDECDSAGQLDFYGIQRMGVESMFESGAALVRRRTRRASDGLHVPLQYQVLEPDHIDLGKEENGSGGVTIQGIARDAIGALAGYWLFTQHPGAVTQNFRTGNFTSKFIPATEVIHAYPHERPGQEHGVPFLAPAMMLLRDMDEYNEAEILRAKVQACLAVSITQPEDPDGHTVAPSGTEQGTGKRIEYVRPAMFVYGKPGEVVDFKAPAGHASFAEFMKLEQHLMAIAVGMFYAQLTGDLSSVNWSSFRAGDRDFRAMIEAFRWLCVVPMLCDRLWQWFIDAAWLAGIIPVQNYRVTWTPPQFMSVDPLKDAAADEADMANGTLLWDESVARRGNDPNKHFEKLIARQKKLDQAGVVLAWDRRKVSAAGKSQDAPAVPQQ